MYKLLIIMLFVCCLSAATRAEPVGDGPLVQTTPLPFAPPAPVEAFSWLKAAHDEIIVLLKDHGPVYEEFSAALEPFKKNYLSLKQYRCALLKLKQITTTASFARLPLRLKLGVSEFIAELRHGVGGTVGVRRRYRAVAANNFVATGFSAEQVVRAKTAIEIAAIEESIKHKKVLRLLLGASIGLAGAVALAGVFLACEALFMQGSRP